MNKVISGDALRRALTAIPQAAGMAWLDGHRTGSHSAAPMKSEFPGLCEMRTSQLPIT